MLKSDLTETSKYGFLESKDPLQRLPQLLVTNYVREMREYMPFHHREFLETVEKNSQARDFIKKKFFKIS